MRQIYHLTEATETTLQGNAKQIAIAANKSPSYVYKILDNELTDPFSPFKVLYIACLTAGISTTHWDSDLERLRHRFAPKPRGKDLIEALQDKVHASAEFTNCTLNAIRDGHIDEKERRELLTELAKIEQTVKAVRSALNQE